MTRVLVTGAGGFIGHHLVTYLKQRGEWVRGADLKFPDYRLTDADEFYRVDLRIVENCRAALADIDEVYHLAADMGGIGYITASHADITRNNIRIDTNMVDEAMRAGVRRFFYSSSACVYPQYLQGETDGPALREDDAYPADSEKGYGWEKLWMEQLCSYYAEDHGLPVRIARFHNAYGPYGTYEGGKEKAPAAICRKVALAPDGAEIEVWGDGEQTRSFMYIDDCVEGIYLLAQSDHATPLNIGSDELVSVNGLVDLVCTIAGKTLVKVHDLSKPQGVRGRNSDNTLCRQVLGWSPSVPLEEGLMDTYDWIESRLP